MPRARSCQTVFAIAANGTAPGLALPVQPPVRRRELLQTNMEKFLKVFVACGPPAATPSQHHQVAALGQHRARAAEALVESHLARQFVWPRLYV